MSSQSNGALFEESSRGGVGAITAIVFILSMVLSIGGFVLMSYGFNPTLGAAGEQFFFIGGLAATIIGFALPFTLLPAIGK
ncbi:hypothetical protein [Leucobacter luti]|uniref:Uncharacterized protein n=1 Tax=Leucobacter luti TaxID=340320 RepID=A0A4R6S4A3_9MICO|nr:hypothetical protein [Leucobacter luti]MCW2287299.1 hypothetical protein [Leucobacter luti]QYM76633.1 hypothetical protein K1X41_04210 [Leucobacter luti]TCK41522.1 hypothetical protein EDF60_1952 [Leucobacter luti]TDP94500.1 hypothetical protein EDF62_0919 [Leucobacter luti]